MKTAVEQFYNAIIDQIALSDEHLEMIKSYKEQAKEMELDKLKEAYSMGRLGKSIKEFNETFKSE